ncbi:hypothetical protein SAMN05518672_1011256 [Chitinophaga sp. CF118]|uniref:hypothetical protein n=1 Tax=Chitinophaga sp. CF118 TaxID=1884367 RepID=UPI0008E20DF3|nr:hypothetical protein [Chitinophaga sp. CF118]SFD24845.1 hypothetical protein SAMN05518672_1011256 [Chitinophaga sp. CF118]
MRSRDNDIANELKDIVPEAIWPGLTPAMGDVPAGYFEQLPAQIMQKIAVQEELETISPLLAEGSKTLPLSVPSGYFEQLPTQIIQKIAVQEELETISPLLADINKTPSLSAPAGYFEQLSAQIMQKINVQEELEAISPLLADINKTPSLSAPAGYFEQLSAQIMQKINVQEELEAISPLLADINKTPSLSAPAGYFEQLSAQIMQKINVQEEAEIQTTVSEPAKVVPMRARRTYLKWAVAACLIALISAGTLFFVQNSQHTTAPVVDNNLADVSDQAIVEYLQAHMDAFDKEELLSLASLNINSGTVPLPETSEMSSDAIQRYLDNSGFLKESPTEN